MLPKGGSRNHPALRKGGPNLNPIHHTLGAAAGGDST